MGLDPEGAVALAAKNPDGLREKLVAYASSLKRSGRTDAYIAKSFTGFRNFLAYRHVEFNGFPKLSPTQGTTLEAERIPTPEELGRVLERLTLRHRVVALFIAHAGVRPHVLGTYGGETGLTLGDLPDLEISPTPTFKMLPFEIRVPASLSKTRKAYTTFGTQQLAETFLAFLTERAEGGERLDRSSPVIPRARASRLRGAAKMLANTKARFQWTSDITEPLGKVLHASQPEGVTWRPYVLRSYCSTRLMLGSMTRDLREAILGHDTGVAGKYTVGKRWGSELLEEARREYEKASEFLETNARPRVNLAAEFRRTLLAVAGMSDEEAAKHVDDSNEELLAILREKLTGRGAAQSSPVNGNGNGNGHGVQKPFTLEEAEPLLTQGWTYVANFGPNRVLLQAPP